MSLNISACCPAKATTSTNQEAIHSLSSSPIDPRHHSTDPSLILLLFDRPRRLTMVLLDNPAFLKSLKKLYEDSRSSGAVYLSFKSVSIEEIEKNHRKGASKEAQATSEYVCLVRATNGKGTRRKEKISTMIRNKDVVGFQLALQRLVVAATDNMKKPERKKKKKKPTAAASAVGAPVVGGGTAPKIASKHL